MAYYDLKAMGVAVSSIEKALAGDSGQLVQAFTWEESPQGFDFWENQCVNGLTIKGKTALKEILAQVEAEDYNHPYGS